MATKAKLANPVRKLLLERSFTESQIQKITPRLQDEHRNDPSLLERIIERWNLIMSCTIVDNDNLQTSMNYWRACAAPPRKSLMEKFNINMNTILADVEPDLLLLEPDKLLDRHRRIQNLGLIKNLGEHWVVLFHAPRGFYLQSWADVLKKIYYIEHNVLDLLYDKKEQREMKTNPLIKSAAVTEVEFDHIRTRYLFALRSGYKSLSHMFGVQTALTRPTLKDMILAENEIFLSKFAPFCSMDEYKCFANLIKSHNIDDDDADIYHDMAELEALDHSKEAPLSGRS